MEWLDLLRWLHVLGACVLIGTGSGIAFFMVMAHRTGQPAVIAHTASVVVVADMVFTAAAVVLQPVTGVLLALGSGWPLTEGWIIASVALYLLIGACWLPVVAIQMVLRSEAWQAVENGAPLSNRYHRLYRVWFACGIPAFSAILLLLWLMITRPAIAFW